MFLSNVVLQKGLIELPAKTLARFFFFLLQIFNIDRIPHCFYQHSKLRNTRFFLPMHYIFCALPTSEALYNTMGGGGGGYRDGIFKEKSVWNRLSSLFLQVISVEKSSQNL